MSWQCDCPSLGFADPNLNLIRPGLQASGSLLQIPRRLKHVLSVSLSFIAELSGEPRVSQVFCRSTTSPTLFFNFETESHYVAQAGLTSSWD